MDLATMTARKTWRDAFCRVTSIRPSLTPAQDRTEFFYDGAVVLALVLACTLALVALGGLDVWLGLGLLELRGGAGQLALAAILAVPTILAVLAVPFLLLVSLPASLVRGVRGLR
jgi:hypothetical protein